MTGIGRVRAIAQIMQKRLEALERGTPADPAAYPQLIALIDDESAEAHRSAEFREVSRFGRSANVHLAVPAADLGPKRRQLIGYDYALYFSAPLALLTPTASGSDLGVLGCFAVSGSSACPESEYVDLDGRRLVTAQWLSDEFERRRSGRGADLW